MEDADAAGLSYLEHWEIASVLRSKAWRNVKPEDLAAVGAGFSQPDDKPVLARCEDLIVLDVEDLGQMVASHWGNEKVLMAIRAPQSYLVSS